MRQHPRDPRVDPVAQPVLLGGKIVEGDHAAGSGVTTPSVRI
jgi:hypothetical protein